MAANMMAHPARYSIIALFFLISTASLGSANAFCTGTPDSECVLVPNDGTVSVELIPKSEFRRAEEACNDGDVSECTTAGLLYKYAINSLWDGKRAAALFKKACSGNDGQGCWYSGGYDWDAEPRKKESALVDFKKGCSLGDEYSCLSVGVVYENYYLGTPEDALAIYSEQCALLNYKGCKFLGSAYRFGVGTKVDYDTAVSNLRIACKNEHMPGCTELGQMFVDGLGVVESMPSAAKLYRQACDAGEPIACLLLGAYIYQERIAKVDGEDAFPLIQKSCDLGLQRACNLAAKFE